MASLLLKFKTAKQSAFARRFKTERGTSFNSNRSFILSYLCFLLEMMISEENKTLKLKETEETKQVNLSKFEKYI